MYIFFITGFLIEDFRQLFNAFISKEELEDSSRKFKTKAGPKLYRIRIWTPVLFINPIKTRGFNKKYNVLNLCFASFNCNRIFLFWKTGFNRISKVYWYTKTISFYHTWIKYLLCNSKMKFLLNDKILLECSHSLQGLWTSLPLPLDQGLKINNS